MVEIAANRYKMRPVDWARLLVKLDFEDARRLEDELISPADMEEMEAVPVTLQELVQMMKELSPADKERMQVLYAFNEAKEQSEARMALLEHQVEMQILQGETRNRMAVARYAAENQHFINNMDSDYTIEYRYSSSGSSAFDW